MTTLNDYCAFYSLDDELLALATRIYKHQKQDMINEIGSVPDFELFYNEFYDVMMSQASNTLRTYPL